MEETRLKYEKPSNYCRRILVGNWFEDRCSYKKSIHKHPSIYSTEYTKKSFSANDPGVIWDAKIKAEGFGLSPVITSDETPNFYDNFSTTYDIAYNHIPNWYSTPIDRVLRFRLERHEPIEEYINSYGNITKSGLAEDKKEEWRSDISDPRTTAYSLSQATYCVPENEYYKFVRWSRTSPPKNVRNPRNSLCNVITWECEDDERPKCCCI